jgi:hypothetical protein
MAEDEATRAPQFHFLQVEDKTRSLGRVQQNQHKCRGKLLAAPLQKETDLASDRPNVCPIVEPPVPDEQN